MQNVNFFKKQGGRWFSQRTTHYLKAGNSKAGKSDLEVVALPWTATEVVQLCSQSNLDVANVVGTLKITQKSTILAGPTKSQSTLLVAISTDETSGKILRQADNNASIQISKYRLENNQVLVVTTEINGLHAEERWWFITDNLRMRTNVLTGETGQVMASFCSEIRLGDVKS